MSKYFLVNPNIDGVEKELLERSRKIKEYTYRSGFEQKREEDSKKLSEEDYIRHIEGKVVVKIDIDSKDSWTFENGTKIEYKRRFNNFNQRETQPVNAIVISGEGIKKGAEILIHPNAVHDTNRIFDYKDSNDSIRYYSIQSDMCFAWYDGKDWQPLTGFDLALRVFKPYEGMITGIKPTLLKDTLFVTSGSLKNKAVKTLISCDYEIIAQGKNGREMSLIRFRPNGDGKTKREPEAIAILDDVTENVLSGKYLIGYNTSNAKTIQEINPHDRP